MLEKFKQARELINRGWCQGTMFKCKGMPVSPDWGGTFDQCCLLGAVYAVAQEPMRRKMNDHLSVYHYRFISWQDEPNRTKEDILRLLDCIIEDLENVVSV